MAYSDFAYWYDAFNVSANYDRLCSEILYRFKELGQVEGIVADLGCGTGEMSIRLSRLGYDVIAIDSSIEMLCVCREKLAQEEGSSILLLNQDLSELDLFGTIQGAISTFDTLNHLPKEKLQAALQRVSLFMEKEGVFIFDVNTPFKHEHILADNTFDIEDEEGHCVWHNTHQPAQKATTIQLEATNEGRVLFAEIFEEYYYSLREWEEMLESADFRLQSVCDGETFAMVTATTQRYLFVATKK